MYKAEKKFNVIRRYMEALALHTSAPTLHWYDRNSFISIVESKRVTPRVKQFDVHVCFLQEKFDNGLFITKYEKSSVMPEDMCNKPCACPIISRSTK